ncbi:PQQ-binding-like beta-propeller repeat protein [Thalassoglobus sp. JC818]|uniref:outer membrane protein assembly factor BamB family protein n=1 Tax=Thalassoglobus sp. JC818 TaxID=3232136 RepID=UPI003457686E
MRLVFCWVLSACLFGQFSEAAHGDWRQFRGNQSNGLPEAPGRDWDGDQEVLWEADLPGRGLSSPIIIGDRVYVTASSGGLQERLHVLCFSATDGSKIWERTCWATGRTVCHPKTCVAAPSPASDGKRIFAFYSSNDLICLDLDGNLQWFRGLTYEFPNASNSLGMASSTISVGGKVVVMLESDDASFAAGLDADTGETTWKIDRPQRANWTSPSIAPDGKTILMQSSAGVSAIDSETGAEIWKYSDGAATQPTLVMVGEVAYVPSHGVTAIRPGRSDTSVPEILWQVGNLSPGVASPIAYDEKLFVINNGAVMSAASLEDGKRLWQSRLKGPMSASPVVVGNKIFTVNEEGTTQVIDPNNEGEIISEHQFDEIMLGTPAVTDDGVYVRSDQHLYKIAVD